MTELIDWLRAQLDEDERVARAATPAPWWHNPGKVWLGPEAFERYDRTQGEEFVGYGTSPLSGCVAATGPASHAQSMADAEHIARHDPPRVLAEVDAKRRIVDFCADLLRPDSASMLTDPEDVDPNSWHVVRMLALPYADRPGYREEWRP